QPTARRATAFQPTPARDQGDVTRQRSYDKGRQRHPTDRVSTACRWRGRPVDDPAPQQNESPHAHEFCALGLSIVKPCASMRSAKSMVAPARYGALIRSTTTSTPLNSVTMSPSSERSSKKS